MKERRRPGVQSVSALLALLVIAFTGPAMAATGSGDWQLVTYGPLRFEVPAAWPVFDLTTDPVRCVRLDVNAVYLGHQGNAPDCPATAVGRSESIHLEPIDELTAGRADLSMDTSPIGRTTARLSIGTGAGGMLLASFDDQNVLATLGFGPDRSIPDQILESFRTVPGAGPMAGLPPNTLRRLGPVAPASPPPVAGVFTGEGFDACTAPSETTMNAWLDSPYREIGIYIGGIMRGCSQPSLTSTWVSDVLGMGWSLVPIYVGLQAPCVNQPGLSHIDPKKAEDQGIDAADDAVVQAQLLAIKSGNPIYFDMEAYDSSDDSCVDTVLTFISGWAGELHKKGYLAAMYGGAASGIKNVAEIYGDPDYNQLDDIWYAHWDGVHGVFGDPYFPDDVWPDHQRLHQYAGGHNETWGGVTIYIDNDYNDGATVSLASTIGDFDADGYADLALGAPYDDVNGAAGGGDVNVLYGTAAGLSEGGDQLWSQDSPGVPNGAEGGDHFGYDLAIGDFNADGYADLAVGLPGEDTAGGSNAGAVSAIYGSLLGLDGEAGPGSQYWHQDSDGVRDEDEAGDQFGFSLAVGDFDGDGYPDLAIGVPFEDIDGATDAGGVNVLYGSVNGLTANEDQFWSQNKDGIPSSAESGDKFGYAMVSGDFDADGRDDLAVGVPTEDTSEGDAGAVNALLGSSSGLTGTDAQYWHQDSAGILDKDEAGDQFGRALATADFDADGDADLAIGVPYEDVGTDANAGAVDVLDGSVGGLTAAGNQLWTQDSDGVPSGAEPGDDFGFALAAGDFDGDGWADLAVGVPKENTPVTNAGAVNVLYGSIDGLTGIGAQYWHQDSGGIEGNEEAGDQFGRALGAAGYGDGPQGDLAVGVPYEDVGSLDDAGGANVLYGSDAGLSSEGDQFWDQASPGIQGQTGAGDRLGFGIS